MAKKANDSKPIGNGNPVPFSCDVRVGNVDIHVTRHPDGSFETIEADRSTNAVYHRRCPLTDEESVWPDYGDGDAS